MEKEEYYLSYNKENIFINLIQSEVHFRNLEKIGYSEDEKGHATCIIKHLADAQGEAGEAISHALIVEGPETSQKFRKLKDGLRAFRKRMQTSYVSVEEGIKEIRRLRHEFESFNTEYDVSQCTACGPIEGILKQLNLPLTNLREIEQETAQKILSHLAYKYKVPEPKLVISDECANPAFGVYEAESKPEKSIIRVCRGGVNVHVLTHEFKHYLDHLAGKPLWSKSLEPEAEKFVITELQGTDKTLYKKNVKHNYSHGGNSLLKAKGLLKIYGPDQIAKGLERGFKQIDIVTGRAALPPHQRPSFWLNLAGTIGGIIGGLKLRDPWDYVIAIIGGHMSTTFWDYGEEYVAPALRVIFAPPKVQGGVKYVVKNTPTVTIPATKVKTLPTVTGRYAITA